MKIVSYLFTLAIAATTGTDPNWMYTSPDTGQISYTDRFSVCRGRDITSIIGGPTMDIEVLTTDIATATSYNSGVEVSIFKLTSNFCQKQTLSIAYGGKMKKKTESAW